MNAKDLDAAWAELRKKFTARFSELDAAGSPGPMAALWKKHMEAFLAVRASTIELVKVFQTAYDIEKKIDLALTEYGKIVVKLNDPKAKQDYEKFRSQVVQKKPLEAWKMQARAMSSRSAFVGGPKITT